MLSRFLYWISQAWAFLVASRSRVRSTGEAGEQLAIQFLKRMGYRIVCQGYRESGGEIDIIALDKRTVVFVEVKTRHSDLHGSPEMAVDSSKQRKIVRTATHFLKRNDLLDETCRFDVISILMLEPKPRVKHFKHAFRLEEIE